MLRMQNILFDQNGSVKLQEMSNIFFDEYEIKQSDLIFLPPEILSCKGQKNQNLQLNNSMDIWTLGMIMLHCMCLTYKQSDYEEDTFEEILQLLMQVKGGSLINFEEKLNPEDIEEEENKSKNEDESLSDHSRTNICKNEDTPIAQKQWIDFYSGNT